jgi:hypothetical protein
MPLTVMRKNLTRSNRRVPEELVDLNGLILTDQVLPFLNPNPVICPKGKLPG